MYLLVKVDDNKEERRRRRNIDIEISILKIFQ
jgi:hypothetical protein